MCCEQQMCTCSGLPEQRVEGKKSNPDLVLTAEPELHVVPELTRGIIYSALSQKSGSETV